ncbi:MAG TPA: S24 family peptidase [Candidatus Kapabacteria bacterium]|nr:S24 family peptidase [Candidatus Kapabacteria bacterium]
MNSNIDYNSLLSKCKKMLLAEYQGKKYAADSLKELKAIAEANHSNFYADALEQFHIINQALVDDVVIKNQIEYSELSKLIASILGYDNPYEKLSKQDIIKYFFNLPENIAICQVEGDSMIGADIKEGDYLLYLKTDKVESGELMIVMVDGQKYIKRYQVINEDRILLSENKNYPPFKIGITNNVKILGKVLQILKNVTKL